MTRELFEKMPWGINAKVTWRDYGMYYVVGVDFEEELIAVSRVPLWENGVRKENIEKTWCRFENIEILNYDR